jgi:hypothetical protein
LSGNQHPDLTGGLLLKIKAKLNPPISLLTGTDETITMSKQEIEEVEK